MTLWMHRASLMLLSLGLVAVACTENEAPSSGPSRARSEGPSIKFDIRGGDTFSWTKTVSGRSDCGAVTFEVNGDPVDAGVKMRGSRFTADLSLVPGQNEVLARCGSGEQSSQPLVFNERLASKPTARIKVTVKGDTVTLDGRGSRATEPDGSEVVRYLWGRDPLHPARLTTEDGKAFSKATGPRLRLRAPSEDGEYFVTLDVEDAQGRSDRSTTYFEVQDGRARAADMMHGHPSWIDRAIIYAPIPALMGNGGPKAVQRKLPYLKKLGVDALWLWPPATLRTTGEEYAINDLFEIDPSWGPEPAFKEMAAEAHRLGLRILLDYVPNHLSDQSPYFQDTVKHGKQSLYWDFFDRNGEGKPTHYFDWTNLPNLNYDNPEVRRMIVESSVHWVRDLGIDGFRVDVAWGVKRRRPDFWRDWRRELKRVNPDLLLLAEASAVDPYYFSNGFDVAYDWTNQPGQWAWTSAFDFPEEAGALLAPAITNSGKGYAPDANVMRFLNNNDTGVRFVDQYGPDMTKVAATLQFTLPGTPAMFAGDEIGASYEPYSNLTPIVWRDRFLLRPFYKRLIDLRTNVRALTSSDVNVLSTDTNGALAYVRPGVGGDGPVLVILNFGSKTRVKISNSPGLDAALAGSSGRMRDLLSDQHVALPGDGESLSISMDALSSLVLTQEDS
jgi:cyclomaltodextrinase / maltogenic alpha-amylase / neopullulanase